ncbi:MAG: class B sortase [Hungatella sp.]|nr:class B sortase [Hungatella sp.]
MEGRKKIWKKLLMAVLVLMSAAGLAVIIQKNLDYKKGADDYSEAEQIAGIQEWGKPVKGEPTGQEKGQEKKSEESAIEDPYMQSLSGMDLGPLQEINDDVMGWIIIPDSQVSYPVLQGEDNSYYLNRTWKKEKSAVGCIFLECEVSRDLSDFNTIIYGHKMRNGSMFGSLEKYKEESYWRDHPSVYLVSAEGVRRYDVYAAYEAGVRDITYGLKIKDQEKKEELIQFGKDHSDIDTGIEPTADDRILTLSTCTGRGYRTRWVVQAVEYRENQ